MERRPDEDLERGQISPTKVAPHCNNQQLCWLSRFPHICSQILFGTFAINEIMSHFSATRRVSNLRMLVSSGVIRSRVRYWLFPVNLPKQIVHSRSSYIVIDSRPSMICRCQPCLWSKNWQDGWMAETVLTASRKMTRSLVPVATGQRPVPFVSLLG